MVLTDAVGDVTVTPGAVAVRCTRGVEGSDGRPVVASVTPVRHHCVPVGSVGVRRRVEALWHPPTARR